MSKKSSHILPERRTLSDGVYGYLHNAIITLELEPGQMVYENEIAVSLGVSRTPVREAFRVLRAEELIEVLPQRGARIVYISKKKVEEALFVRLSLEVSAFKEVARRWAPRDERYKELEGRLRSVLREQAKSAKKNEAATFLSWDEDFHRMILEQLENQTLLRVISGMRAHLNRVRFLELTEAHHFSMVIEQHRSILSSVIANEERKISDLIQDHIGHFKSIFPAVMSKYSQYFQA